MTQITKSAIRKIVQIDEELCDGCGLCIPSCAEGALKIIDGKARLVSDKYCDGLGACLGNCPRGAIKITERTAEEFDEIAAKAHVEKQEAHPKPGQQHPANGKLACGCPSTMMRQFHTSEGIVDAVTPNSSVLMRSELTHWPVQIRLVPPTAPFLKNAELVVIADCVPFAYPALHRDFIKNHVVMVGCPKFDDIQSYYEKFVAIFRTAGLRSVTVVSMEVPCCSGIQHAVEEAVRQSGTDTPLEQIVISLQGQILSRQKVAV